jgi:hypothetical protein
MMTDDEYIDRDLREESFPQWGQNPIVILRRSKMFIIE